jgi:voltage-gated potassium channel
VLFDPRSKPEGGFREQVYEVIFETDTRAGLAFDILLLVVIFLAVVSNALETVPSLADYEPQFEAVEWAFTIFFTIEYVLRLWCVRSARSYALSFLGVIDLLSIAPTYLALFFVESAVFSNLRALRLLRVFRVFQLGAFLEEGARMSRAIRASLYRIAVFLVFILVIVVIVGGLIHYIEYDPNWDASKGPQEFDSVPRGVYWAIVTLTTVGYGDISPQNPLGQLLAACLMLMGYGVIAVPTGIVTAEMVRGTKTEAEDATAAPAAAARLRSCHECGTTEDDVQARFCRMCGTPYRTGTTLVMEAPEFDGLGDERPTQTTDGQVAHAVEPSAPSAGIQPSTSNAATLAERRDSEAETRPPDPSHGPGEV